MSSIWCWLLPFLIGVLVGWLLNWLLRRLMHKDQPGASTYANTVSRPTPAPVAPAPAAAAPSVVAPVVAAAAAVPALIDLAGARAAGFTMKGTDDLTVIEGIGPKINELMKSHGVGTFADVASSSVAKLQGVLDAGGSSFKLANPETWPHQAQLIVDNRWNDLKAFQDELGRRTPDPSSKA